MQTNPSRFHWKSLASGLTAVAALALAGCATPFPVYNQPVVQAAPAQVYTYPSQQVPQRDYRRRSNEQLYQADVTSVRAVMGATEQRCWMEREAVPERPAANVPGALIGAVIGGVLGHQVGGGSGRDLATVGGVLAGAAIGSSVGTDRFGNTVSTQDVQRCANEPSRSEPAYWDVTYTFRGITHRAQMTSAPGRSITVNSAGEPRI
ncbi:MAG: glycine zipper 2TM domain-containing protein [Hydrogenophaga sp.]|uniref:glycine zipper 2TM domain-containing protein n=1 Tax=Hydrogenophaga sp. TaxID=1904254 RepID=UPI001BBF68C9|nr:glycine zipper 2TM domain-containing protein [Hydrogenophaga sp.]MBS3912196.1 glycine zipper 2TM domain-containing protein [Hydrogenophaga sp.]MDP2163608.1 glycine zipper 2TM domain-containing protein [Hydrogenophaga sp.]MDP3474771.1 glycine zipper 2TM domain-containing protein [Hydrogenophaga sp.]